MYPKSSSILRGMFEWQSPKDGAAPEAPLPARTTEDARSAIEKQSDVIDLLKARPVGRGDRARKYLCGGDPGEKGAAGSESDEVLARIGREIGSLSL